MNLSSTHSNGVNFITVNETRIDATAAIRFKDAMRGLTCDGPAQVVLDLSQVTFVDSSGLGAIVGAMKQLGSERKLDLAALTPDVAQVFRLTRMDSIFVIHPDIADVAPRAAG